LAVSDCKDNGDFNMRIWQRQMLASSAIKKLVVRMNASLALPGADRFQNFGPKISQRRMPFNHMLPSFLGEIDRIAVSILHDFFHAPLTVLMKTNEK